MKFATCAAALASLSLFASTLAAPVAASPEKPQQTKEEVEAERQKALARQRNKYFHEPGGGHQLGHYDARFFHGIVSDQERHETQLTMIRAYLDYFRENDLDTWLAHGTLLGWWWNGKRLPWDWDMDTQVSGATLHHLGQAHNQTRTKYLSTDGQREREFLLDVNPWIWERERGDGANIIDARWIDTSNGLFIDITGLSETHPDTNPGVWVCKNYHRYATSDLYPMRETLFEGAIAKVPYAYDKILVQEYKEKALVVTDFEGHAWNMNQKEWIKTQAQIDKEAKEAKEQAAREAAEEEKKKKDTEMKRQAAEIKKLEDEEKRQLSQKKYDDAQEKKRQEAEAKRNQAEEEEEEVQQEEE
ncbi:hypothetical protein K504DRAFT_429184 [Pleomassaria siparia CBS 279.74]|uniref:LicD/FKTN/FKRP nucleotidyltransferase domain-containing protein n=1 Tax=Pleomassaria siparia CBS 279.74 TaxID=1314801 RepID=A0A6G1KE66_9PLEO|nr:hypothetical protein K504DRAFT_429184 [Pleomassaria siparia CBS 279.74]